MTMRSPLELMEDFCQRYRELRQMQTDGVFSLDAKAAEKAKLIKWDCRACKLVEDVSAERDLEKKLFLEVNFTPSDMRMLYSEWTYNRGQDSELIKFLTEAGDAMLEDDDAEQS